MRAISASTAATVRAGDVFRRLSGRDAGRPQSYRRRHRRGRGSGAVGARRICLERGLARAESAGRGAARAWRGILRTKSTAGRPKNCGSWASPAPTARPPAASGSRRPAVPAVRKHRRDRHARQRLPAARLRAQAARTPRRMRSRCIGRSAGCSAAGAQGVAMEVSSIGLDQGRVNGVQFGVALFTNLSRDHLDYHGDMERYAAAKTQLFAAPGSAAAVLNLDDVLGVRIAHELAGSGVARAGYSALRGRGQRGRPGVFRRGGRTSAYRRRASPSAVRVPGARRAVESTLLGRFNVVEPARRAGRAARRRACRFDAGGWRRSRRSRRCPGACSASAARASRSSWSTTRTARTRWRRSLHACGRWQPRAAGGCACVFGCGGDRDRGKRPLMGAIAARHADRIVAHQRQPAQRGSDRNHHRHLKACWPRRNGRATR